MASFLRPLALPLILVAVLAATLGFFVTRSISGEPDEKSAQVSFVALPATPTPTPTPTPSPTPPASGGRGGSRRSNCPSGCECSFPPGGTVVVCRGGGAVRIP